MSGKKLHWREVLIYTSGKRRSQSTVRRCYMEWRADEGMPTRCDNPECIFHGLPPEWNGRPLPLILDHANGVNSDNRPSNLRLLCPNCNSQTPTLGGANKGRVKKMPDRFTRVDEEGRPGTVIPVDLVDGVGLGG